MKIAYSVYDPFHRIHKSGITMLVIANSHVESDERGYPRVKRLLHNHNVQSAREKKRRVRLFFERVKYEERNALLIRQQFVSVVACIESFREHICGSDWESHDESRDIRRLLWLYPCCIY